MKPQRTADMVLWAGIFGCLKERPMTMTEMAERILHSTDACGVGRIAVRIESMIHGGMVIPMVVKGSLFFRLNEIKQGKVD